MDKEQEVHQLRVRFIALNMEYTKRVREGETLTELEFLNTEINNIVAEIQSLEQEIKHQQ